MKAQALSDAVCSPVLRGCIQALLVTSLGAAAVDTLVGSVGSIRRIVVEDVPGLVTALVVLVIGLIVGHLIRNRLPAAEWICAPLALAGTLLYALVKSVVLGPDARLAIACTLIGAYTAALSLIDAIPGGPALEARRRGLLDDGATITATLVSSTLATPVFLASPLVHQGWIAPAAVLAATGAVGLLVASHSRRRPDAWAPPAVRHPLLAILRVHVLAIGILVFLVGGIELDWILGELFGSMYMYAVHPQVLVKACALAAALVGSVTGAVAAKACLVARRVAWRVVVAVVLVLGPPAVAGAVLPACIMADWALAGSVMLFIAAGHVAGLVLQFTDAGFKGIPYPRDEGPARSP